MNKMPDNTDKFATMIGFAKRAGKIVYGYDSLKAARGIKLYAVSDTASANLIESMKSLADKKKTPLIVAPALETTIGNNVKALGMTDGNMADAALEFVRKHGNGYRIETDKQDSKRRL